MTITYVEYFKSLTSGVAGGDITSDSISVAVNDIIIIKWIVENNSNEANGVPGPTIGISNTGTALTWADVGNTGLISGAGDSCYVRVWQTKATVAESITISCTGSGTIVAKSSQAVVVHTGAHQANPVPAGNVFTGKNTTDVSQSVTPTASGSALWAAFGDWSATNTFAAITDCTIESTRHDAGAYTCCVIRPTTQPRTDAAAFTIGETDTAGDISYVIFEVQAAPGALPPPGHVRTARPQNEDADEGDAAMYSVKAWW